MSRIVLLAFVAACGIPLVFAIQHFRREPPADTKAATAAPAVSKPASGALDQGPDALAAAQAKADAMADALAGSPVPPDSDDGGVDVRHCPHRANGRSGNRRPGDAGRDSGTAAQRRAA
jgi:hypothetical protein